jgi:hypothetical protein
MVASIARLMASRIASGPWGRLLGLEVVLYQSRVWAFDYAGTDVVAIGPRRALR